MDYKKIINRARTGGNLFITGEAGTGKTTLLKKIIIHLWPRELAVTALTGIAAVAIGGSTLHSFSGIGIGKDNIDKILRKIMTKKYIAKRWLQIETLIIDEISMCSAEIFEKIDKVARFCRKVDRPFGGVQLIIFGDFFQLPPVFKDVEDTRLCFESDVWKDIFTRDNTILLTHNFRQQDDPEFIKVLRSVRYGQIDDSVINTINSKIVDGIPDEISRLYGTNNKTSEYNSNRLHKLEEKESVYIMSRYIKRLIDDFEDVYAPIMEITSDMADWKMTDVYAKGCIAEQELVLRPNSYVILLKNLDVNGACGIKLCNGTRGYVSRFNEDGHPYVNFSDAGKTVEILVTVATWEVRLGNGDILVLETIPLKLAWALTIHKSQGMTLSSVCITADTSIFEKGQFYVALSRLKSLDGLYLTSFLPSSIRTDNKVVEYYRSLEQ